MVGVHGLRDALEVHGVRATVRHVEVVAHVALRDHVLARRARHLEHRVDDRCVLLWAEAGEQRVLLGGGGDAASDGVTLRDYRRRVVLALLLARLRTHAHAPLAGLPRRANVVAGRCGWACNQNTRCSRRVQRSRGCGVTLVRRRACVQRQRRRPAHVRSSFALAPASPPR